MLCRLNDVDNLAKLLNTNPKLVNTQVDAQGWSPLHYSIDSSQIETLKYLIEHGANVNLKTKDGESPLHFAAFRLNVIAIRLLLEAGADVNAQANTLGHETPLDMAVLAKGHLLQKRQIPVASIKNYKPKTSAELRAEDEQLNQVFKLLLSHGAVGMRDHVSTIDN